jgi:hypothetical protein
MVLRGDPPGPDLLDRAIARLDSAPLDGDTSADIDRIANFLAQAGMAPQAAGLRAIREKEASHSS